MTTVVTVGVGSTVSAGMKLAAIVAELRVTFQRVRDAIRDMGKLTSTAHDLRMCRLIVRRLQEALPPVRDAPYRLARLTVAGGQTTP